MNRQERTGPQEEYEFVLYPKLNHVKVGQVDIIMRNFHLHRELELGLVVDGRARLTVGSKSFEIHRGSLFFCNSNETHEITALDYESVKIIYLQLANNFCQDYLHLFRNFELLESDLSRCLTEAQSDEITAILVRIVEDYLDDGPLSLLNCMSDLCTLFSRLLSFVPYRQFEESVYQARKKKAARLHRITEYIDSHSSGKVSLSELAAGEGVSVSYLSHFFHSSVGMTFQDYVNNVRLSKALKLMVNSNMRMLDISLESGFSDMKYLNQMFEKRFGCTAREYRSNQHIELTQEEPSNQNQHFVSRQIALNWIRSFRPQDMQAQLPLK